LREREGRNDKVLVTRSELLRLDSFFAKLSSLVQNNLMTTERREMNDCQDLYPIREGFYKLL
jgi:hypothetical protein